MTASARALLVCLSLALGGPAVKAQESDLVVLRNGDSLHGEIKRLERGQLVFKTEAMDNVSIAWSFVTALETDQTLEVSLQNGTRLYGSLSTGAGPSGTVTVRAELPSSVQIADIVSMVPLEEGFVARLDGSISLGLTTRSANDETDFHLALDAARRTPRTETSLEVSSTLATKEGADSTNRQVATFGFERVFSHRSRWWSLARLDHNEELGLNLRTTLGTGYSRFLARTNHNSLSWLGGLSANREDYGNDAERSDDSLRNNLEGLLALDYQLFRFQAPQRADLGVSLSALPSLTSWGRVRSELNANGRYELFKDLFLGLDLWYSYDSDPPTVDRVKSDWGAATTLGFSF